MANYKHPSERASETVTFRLTVDERHLLNHLAEIEEKSLTELIRQLLVEQGKRMGIEEVPLPHKVRKRVERPKAQAPVQRPTPTPHPQPASIPPGPRPVSSVSNSGAMTVGDLVDQFREHFSKRAEGTRKELEETVSFLCHEGDGEPLLPPTMALRELTSEKLAQVREKVMKLDLRVAKKNLHLTYLRMLLHWAVKQAEIDLIVNPALDLRPFTLSEIPQAWPGRYY